MDELLEGVLEAHGGLERWARATELTAEMSFGGPFWAARGWPDILASVTVTIDPHREHISFTPFSGAGLTSVLDVDPERVRIVAADGRVVEERIDPRASYPYGPDVRTARWDAIQVAYFASAATWNYLTAPYVFIYPGVEAREIEPWRENGQTWRRLAVSFPPTIANHNPDQVFYYDEHLMQRRMDYSPDVTGNPLIAHYSDEPRTFDGFVFPTRRRVHLRDADGVADRGLAAISVDVRSVSVRLAAGGRRPEAVIP